MVRSPFHLLVLVLVGAVLVGIALGCGNGTEEKPQSEARPFGTDRACKGPDGRCGWSVQNADTLGVETGTFFKDVACPSPTSCAAVSGKQDAEEGHVELWRAGRWRTFARLGANPKAISCPSPSWCIVLGNDPPRSWQLELGPAAGPGRQRVEAIPPPFPPGASELLLNDVSCHSKISCIAVGIYYKGGFKTYVAHWNGRTWSSEPAVNRPLGVTHGMLGVSCPSPTYCVAVGSYELKPLLEHWDGSQWDLLPIGDPGRTPEANVEAVSCTSPRACMAVGTSIGPGGGYEPFSARWDGSSWSTVRAPAPTGRGDARLYSVSCLSSTDCIAVGSVADSSTAEPRELTIAEGWNGERWVLLPTPSPKSFSALSAVSCASVAACTAVGRAGPSAAGEERGDSSPLAERFG
jgi:hypothetical protein